MRRIWWFVQTFILQYFLREAAKKILPYWQATKAFTAPPPPLSLLAISSFLRLKIAENGFWQLFSPIGWDQNRKKSFKNLLYSFVARAFRPFSPPPPLSDPASFIWQWRAGLNGGLHFAKKSTSPLYSWTAANFNVCLHMRMPLF